MPKKKGTEKTQDTKIQEAGAAAQVTAADGANFLNAPVVTLPRFNPHDRPATTREPDTHTPIRQSYEDVQREAKGPGVEEWRKADKLRADLTNLYNTLREDERYAPEYKSERAWQEYEKVRQQVEQLAPEARDKLLKGAEGLERLSIPRPEGEGLLTKDTDKLLLTAHERDRLERLLDRAEKQGERTRGQLKRDPHDILKAEYARALSEGGPGGGATVRAVYELARDWGLDIDTIVDKHRKHYHHEALEGAQRRRIWANMIGRSVPQPPFESGPSSPRDVGTYSNKGPKAFIPQKKGMYFAPKNRRAPWK